jgi:antitoxin ParD1/3/4
MPAKYHRHVALTEPLSRFINEQVTEGRYSSASEVVQAALRLLERQETGAWALTQEGDHNA